MANTNHSSANGASRVKLTGRAFYESLGSPNIILAPMVDRSEFAWRLLSRSYLRSTNSKSLLAYSPMLHARLFTETPKFRDHHFQPTRQSLITKEAKSSNNPPPAWLDGNPDLDRPLFVQFCANKPEDLLEAAQYVAPYCDAVDLNLGCPQGIAKAGHYGAFLQEDWDTIYKMINTLHRELSIPVTAKMRVLDTKEKTLEYAKMILSAGASILTVHGRRREQKGHNMGVADWKMIKYLRDNLPPETVLFANGNILNHDDLKRCLDETGVDGIMSAEGNLSDPTIFAGPPPSVGEDGEIQREYWVGTDGKGGYRLDGVFRRYLDIIHQYVFDQTPPTRRPLYLPGDEWIDHPKISDSDSQPPPNKKRKRDPQAVVSPNLKAMQGHLFHMLKPMLAIHTDIRDALARVRMGDMSEFEKILAMVENAVRKGLDEENNQRKEKGDNTTQSEEQVSIDADSVAQPPSADISPDTKPDSAKTTTTTTNPTSTTSTTNSSQETILKYKRPWWICQPYIRPLPNEAIQKGSLTLSKKEKARLENTRQEEEGKVVGIQRTEEGSARHGTEEAGRKEEERPREALVCG